MSEDKYGFLSRWSRRKLDARQAERATPAPPDLEPDSGRAATTLGVSETAPALDAVVPPAGTDQTTTFADPSVGSSPADGPAPTITTAAPASSGNRPAPPTLDDVAALTSDSDFSLFVGRDVAPEVKNAAMKKLFADPHFNVMDGLDTYIDDYSTQEVMPPSMLRKMASARVLNLYTDEDEARDAAEDARLAALDADPVASAEMRRIDPTPADPAGAGVLESDESRDPADRPAPAAVTTDPGRN